MDDQKHPTLKNERDLKTSFLRRIDACINPTPASVLNVSKSSWVLPRLNGGTVIGRVISTAISVGSREITIHTIRDLDDFYSGATVISDVNGYISCNQAAIDLFGAKDEEELLTKIPDLINECQAWKSAVETTQGIPLPKNVFLLDINGEVRYNVGRSEMQVNVSR